MARKRQIQFLFAVPTEEGLFGKTVLLYAVDEKRAIMSAQTWLDMHLREYGFLQQLGTSEWKLVTCSEYYL